MIPFFDAKRKKTILEGFGSVSQNQTVFLYALLRRQSSCMRHAQYFYKTKNVIQLISLKYDQKPCRVKAFFDAISALFA